MAQPTPCSNYTVQQGDTLFSIARKAYGDANQWQKIYDANVQVIGGDPNLLRVGEVLHVPFLAPKTCKVTAANGLNIRAQATSNSALIATYPTGTALNFVAVVHGGM